jgi:hypothetical protein
MAIQLLPERTIILEEDKAMDSTLSKVARSLLMLETMMQKTTDRLIFPYSVDIGEISIVSANQFPSTESNLADKSRFSDSETFESRRSKFVSPFGQRINEIVNWASNHEELHLLVSKKMVECDLDAFNGRYDFVGVFLPNAYRFLQNENVRILSPIDWKKNITYWGVYDQLVEFYNVRENHFNREFKLERKPKNTPFAVSFSHSKNILSSNKPTNVISRRDSMTTMKPLEVIFDWIKIRAMDSIKNLSSFWLYNRNQFNSPLSKYFILQRITSYVPKQSDLKQKTRKTASYLSFGDKKYNLFLNKYDVNMPYSEHLQNDIKEIQTIFSTQLVKVLKEKSQAMDRCEEDKQEQEERIMLEGFQDETGSLCSMPYFSSDESVDKLFEAVAGSYFDEEAEEIDLTIYDLTRAYRSLAIKPKLSLMEEEQLSIILELAKYDKELSSFIDKIDWDIAREKGFLTAEDFILGLPHQSDFSHDQKGDIQCKIMS